jgi:hypothetical protein
LDFFVAVFWPEDASRSPQSRDQHRGISRPKARVTAQLTCDLFRIPSQKKEIGPLPVTNFGSCLEAQCALGTEKTAISPTGKPQSITTRLKFSFLPLDIIPGKILISRSMWGRYHFVPKMWERFHF